MLIAQMFQTMNEVERAQLRQSITNPLFVQLLMNCENEVVKKFAGINETLTNEQIALAYKEVKIELMMYQQFRLFLTNLTTGKIK